jgi:hypothetical protein
VEGYGENGGKLILRTVHEQPQDPTRKREQDKPRKLTKGTPRLQADPINVQKSAWRARAEIERWVRMNCTRDKDYRLTTGTKRGGMQSVQECWDAVAAMRRQVDKHYPGTVMLAVPELHKGGGINDGTYHVHMIIVFPRTARPMFAVFHRMWKRALGGTGAERGADAPGNFDFAKTHAADGTRYTACQGARYIAKYVTKDIYGGAVGQKRFTTTHGSPEPAKRYYWEPFDTNHAATRSRSVQLLRQFYPASEYVILSKTFHDGGDTYHVFSAEPVPKRDP